MDVSELRGILLEHGHDPASCARELLRAASETRREDLVISFSVVLGTGRLNAPAAHQLLHAFELLKSPDSSEIEDDEGLVALRAEVASLHTLREEARQRQESLVALQDVVQRLEAKESFARKEVSSLEEQIREFEAQRERLAVISAGVGQ